MKEYIQLDNGETIEYLDQKNNEVIDSLQEIIKDFKSKEAKDKSGRKKFGFMLSMQIEDTLGKYGRMSADEFVNLTADDIDDLWWHFHSLMAYFNRYFEIVPNRQSFMLYARINSRQYKNLMESKDEDMRSVIAFIEDRLVGKGFSAGESGNANDKAVMNRLRTADAGHNLVSASEERVIKTFDKPSPEEILKKVKLLTDTEVKKIK